MFWRIWLICVLGVALCGAGAMVYFYARGHQPSPSADPWAVRLLSRSAYARLHYTGLALLGVGALILVSVLVLIFRGPGPTAILAERIGPKR